MVFSSQPALGVSRGQIQPVTPFSRDDAVSLYEQTTHLLPARIPGPCGGPRQGMVVLARATATTCGLIEAPPPVQPCPESRRPRLCVLPGERSVCGRPRAMSGGWAQAAVSRGQWTPSSWHWGVAAPEPGPFPRKRGGQVQAAPLQAPRPVTCLLSRATGPGHLAVSCPCAWPPAPGHKAPGRCWTHPEPERTVPLLTVDTSRHQFPPQHPTAPRTGPALGATAAPGLHGHGQAPPQVLRGDMRPGRVRHLQPHGRQGRRAWAGP